MSVGKQALAGTALIIIAGALMLAVWAWPDAAGASRVQPMEAVSIADSSFTPRIITVTVGTVITWTNNGSFPHTVTSDTGLFASGTLSGGGAYARTFDQAGTFPYYCSFHGGAGGVGMSGVVVVQGTSPTPVPSATPNPSNNVYLPVVLRNSQS